MYFSDEDLRHLESLAMIDLDKESREKLRLQLSRIIDFVRDIDRIEGRGHQTGPEIDRGSPEGRGDVPYDGLSRDDVLGQAPDTHDGFFRVPPVIDDE